MASEQGPVLIFDGDYPMAYGAVDLQRDLTLPLAQVRAAEAGSDNVAMASLPEMRRGRIAAALVKVVGRIGRPGNPLPGYRTAELAHAMAHAHLAYYRVLEAQGEVAILATGEALRQHLQTWSAAATCDHLPVGLVLGMEGADPILWPEQVPQWREVGLRVVSLTHYGLSTYAHGTGTPGGLLPPARPLLRQLEETGLILDLTHLADEGFWQALDLFGGPVIASHHNCRALVPGERQLDDGQLKALIQRGGVIGVAMDTWMLHPTDLNWGGPFPARRSRFPRTAVTLDQLADHLDHVCQLAGNARHAALGGDTDGQGGREGAPLEIDTVADYQKVAPVLARRGYRAEDIAAILHGNWQHFYEQWLPAASPPPAS